MPTLGDLGLDVDLAATPIRYPGPLPATSGLLVGDRFRPLQLADHRRLGQARVHPEPDAHDDGPLPLSYVLLHENVAAVDTRTLVVAVGSNASPAVLARKFGPLSSQVVPVVAGTLAEVGVGHSAHVSASGYVAAAPYRSPGAATRVWVALLDDAQVARLDETEPNYERRRCSSGLTLDTGEQPGAFYLYVSRWGVVRPPGEQPLPLGPQSQVLGRLTHDVPGLADPGTSTPLSPKATLDLLAALAADDTRRDAVRDALATAGWVQDNGLADLPVEDATVPYGSAPTAWVVDDEHPGGGFTVRSTPDELGRDGEPRVVVHPDDAAAQGLGEHATARALGEQKVHSVVVHVHPSDRQAPGTLGVDQVVRNALGVEVGERLLVEPAVTEVNRAADTLLARPHFVVCRVQAADLTTVEQPVALLDPLAMSILGLTSGDEVVVEGDSGPDGRVLSLRLKAHALPDDVRERREDLSGGGLDARFPSARDALAVYPDLPWMFLDSAARAALGLDAKLAAVRVRASRRYQWSQEIRELLLILVVAFVGLATIEDSPAVLITVVSVITVATVLLVRWRVRLRLQSQSRTLRRRGR